MARGGGGLRTAIKVVKAIDRINKQVVKNADRQRKQNEREEARCLREHEKTLKEMERKEKTLEKAKIAGKKKLFKDNLEKAQEAYESSVPRQTVCNLLSFSRPRFTFSRISVADLVHM